MNMKKLYKKIAQKHGVTPEEVERDMQTAINSAYEDPNFHAQKIPSKGAMPTIEEFINYISEQNEE